jgi:voltage-gated potassium channel
MATRVESGGPYLLFMLVLSVFAIFLLGVDVALPVATETREILIYADDALCLLFFGDFCLTLWRAENRWRYFLTWGWIDLLSCIPTVDWLRAGRAARVFRIFRVLRAIRAAKFIADFILRRRAQGALLAASLLAMLLVVVASIGVLQFETVAEANIKTAEDALWWAMTTITTVGYGDRFPVTSEGRMLGVALMLSGVGVIGAYTGYVASWFLQPAETGNKDEIAALRTEIETLRNTETSALLAELAWWREERERQRVAVVSEARPGV